MKTIMVFLIAVCSACGHLKNTNNNDYDRQILLATIDAFNKAFAAGQVEMLESMVCENYQHTNGYSKAIGKSEWIAYLQKRKADVDQRRLVVDDYQMKETQISIFDDTAIVTGRIVVRLIQDGDSTVYEYRVTNVWIREGANWKRAGFHDSKVM